MKNNLWEIFRQIYLYINREMYKLTKECTELMALHKYYIAI